MAIWGSDIAASTEGPDQGSGFVRAATAEEALRLVGHPEANVYPCCDDVAMPEGAARCGFPDGTRGTRQAAESPSAVRAKGALGPSRSGTARAGGQAVRRRSRQRGRRSWQQSPSRRLEPVSPASASYPLTADG